MRRRVNFSMEHPGIVVGNFAPNFSLNFLSIFLHISGPIRPITLIWASLERSFPPAEVEYRWCQFWSKVMTSKEEERPRFTTGGYGRHRHQWVNLLINHLVVTNENGTFKWLSLRSLDKNFLPQILLIGGNGLVFRAQFEKDHTCNFN